MGFLIVNIQWQSNRWTGKPTESEQDVDKSKSGFRWVRDGEGTQHECFNFSEEAVSGEHKYGFVKFTKPPREKKFEIVFFYSKGKIVGLYHSAEIIEPKYVQIQDMKIGFNIRCPKNEWILFDEFVELDKDRHLRMGEFSGERIGQAGFNYVDDSAAANLLEDIASSSKDEGIKNRVGQLRRTIAQLQVGKYGSHLSGLLYSKSQVILYGPPGTGKTFNAKRMAMEFIEPNHK